MKSLGKQIVESSKLDNLLIRGISISDAIKEVYGFNILDTEKDIRKENGNNGNGFPNTKTNYRKKHR